jgi:hypothetical protein
VAKVDYQSDGDDGVAINFLRYKLRPEQSD